MVCFSKGKSTATRHVAVLRFAAPGRGCSYFISSRRHQPLYAFFSVGDN
jgi:hypothetical protein